MIEAVLDLLHAVDITTADSHGVNQRRSAR